MNIMKELFKFLLGVLLFVVAWAFLPVFVLLNMLFVLRKNGTLQGYFLNTAISLDCWANREFRTGLNATMITKASQYRFGNIQETMSSVLGKNKLDETLSWVGIAVANLLDFLDRNHCYKSINWTVKSP